MPDRAAVLQAVKEIVSVPLALDVMDVSGIDDTAQFEADLDADSLDLVELGMELEEAAGIKISDEALQGLTGVGEVADYLMKPDVMSEEKLATWLAGHEGWLRDKAEEAAAAAAKKAAKAAEEASESGEPAEAPAEVEV